MLKLIREEKVQTEYVQPDVGASDWSPALVRRPRRRRASPRTGPAVRLPRQGAACLKARVCCKIRASSMLSRDVGVEYPTRGVWGRSAWSPVSPGEPLWSRSSRNAGELSASRSSQ